VKYHYLSQLGEQYANEQGLSGHRFAALSRLETHLKQAITDLNVAVKRGVRRLIPVPAVSRSAVHKLIAAHETAQLKAAGPNANLAELQARVQRYLAWLKRQHCVVKANGSIDWGLSNHVVEYDHSLAQQGMTRLHVLGGRLFTDAAGTKPLDTTDMVTMLSGPGHAIFVMSATGNIHVSSHSVGYRHHSSLLAGRDVAGAGELKANNGCLVWLSNKSGHYVPSVGHLLQSLHQMQKGGVPMTFALTVLPDNRRFATVGEYLSELGLQGEPDYDLMRLMRYSAHLTDAILGTHTPGPWHWRDAALGEASGVYNTVTNQFVAHKVVRGWLKSRGLSADVEVQSGRSR